MLRVLVVSRKEKTGKMEFSINLIFMKKEQNPFCDLVLLGGADVADMLGLSRGYINHELVKKNLLPYQKTSSGYIFEQESVLAFQKKRIEKSKYDPRVRL